MGVTEESDMVQQLNKENNNMMLGGEERSKIDGLNFQKWFKGLKGKRMPLIRGK